MTLRSLDEVRAAFPQLGLALYAYEPGGPVTLEIHAPEGVFTFSAETEELAIAAAFPEPPPPPPPPPVNVFD